MEHLLQDLKHAARALKKRRGLTCVAVATLAIGLGGNAAMFTVVNAVLLKPLPYAAPDRLFAITGMSYAGEFIELQRRARTFDVAAYVPRQVTLTGESEPLRVPAAAVSPNFVTLLGARPLRGRALADGDELSREGAVVLIAHQLWRGRFGADPNIVGRRAIVDGTPRTIVGVMPPSFAFPAIETQMWIPSAGPNDRIALWSTSRLMVGRLRPGASVSDADAEVRAIAPAMRALFPWSMPADYGRTAAAVPLRDALVKNVRTTLLLLLAAVATVLLIACVNVSHLLLARTRARERELAIRMSLGAGSARILKHLFAEGVLIVALGLAVALPLAFTAVQILTAWLPADLPRPVEIAPDARTLLFMAAVLSAAVLLVGLLPALRASRFDLAPRLADTQRGGERRATRWMSNALVGVQMALAVVLIVTATLLVRTLTNLSALSPGFEVQSLLSARISPPSFRFADAPSKRELYASVLERAAQIPGVSAAAVTDPLPFGGETFGGVFVIEGRPDPAKTGEWPMADVSAVVSTGVFDTLGIALTEGRIFTGDDTATAMRTAVVSETLARRYWPGESPLGRRFTFPGDPAGMRTIVGVVADVKWVKVTDEPQGSLYVPLSQASPNAMRLVTRTNGDAQTTFEQLKSIVRTVDPDTPVDQMRTLLSLVNASVEQPRFAASLLSTFAIAGLLLGAIGIYGTVAEHVTERRREIGIRIALGAQRGDVIRGVVRGTLTVVACGALAGVAAAVASSRVFATLLFGVTPTDVTTLVVAVGALTATAVAAAYPPARRASSVDPLASLRE
jgi:predicted permease